MEGFPAVAVPNSDTPGISHPREHRRQPSRSIRVPPTGRPQRPSSNNARGTDADSPHASNAERELNGLAHGHANGNHRERGSDTGRASSTRGVPERSNSKGKNPRDKNDTNKPRAGSYQALGLHIQICESLSRAGYGFPTPIQRKTIPPALAGNDVVVMARTGSGKTAAFLAPLLHRLAAVSPLVANASRRNGPRGLIIAPTRELALQTFKFFNLYSRAMTAPLRAAVVVGGTPLEAQFEALAVCPDLVIATPGRLLHILAEMGAKGGLTLSTVETVVFDEADRLFEGTLAVETATLVTSLASPHTERIGNDRQTILVSATMPRALAEFSRTGLRQNCAVIRLDVDKSMSPTMAAAFISTRGDDEKDASLLVILRRVIDAGRTAVVFAATHRRVEYLTDLLRKYLLPAVDSVHGNMDQVARTESVANFRKGDSKILIVTDVAARGIDLPELDTVVNYDMGATPKIFVHRVGRVARAGRPGMTLSLITADESPFMIDVHLFLGRGVIFPESHVTEEFSGGDPWVSHAVAMESSFLFGSLPKSVVDEEVEIVRKACEDVDIRKARQAARNAHGLFIKTRGVASGESNRRAKELVLNGDGGRRMVPVHPWFVNMESLVERTAGEEAARLSSWRPKETAVQLPKALLARKRRRAVVFEDAGGDMTKTEGEDGAANAKSILSAAAVVIAAERPVKRSARQIAVDEQRKQFYVPLRRDESAARSDRAMKVVTGGAMGDGIGAFHAIQAATMDINADNNVDLLRSKHMGGPNSKYWDRVTKKFVKGGVQDKTSKKNLHVASREARARANAGESYGAGDGAMFKSWLSKNRKAVEEMAERVHEGNSSAMAGGTLARHGFSSGLGSNDFRKGAFGRNARIAAASRNRGLGVSGVKAAGKGDARSELKSVDQIKKERKIQKKAEARRAAKNKTGGGRRKAQQKDSRMPSAPGSSKTRVIIHRK